MWPENWATLLGKTYFYTSFLLQVISWASVLPLTTTNTDLLDSIGQEARVSHHSSVRGPEGINKGQQQLAQWMKSVAKSLRCVYDVTFTPLFLSLFYYCISKHLDGPIHTKPPTSITQPHMVSTRRYIHIFWRYSTSYLM